MKKIVMEVLKRVVFAICLLYAFNAIAVGLNIIVPINLVTISVISLIGTSGLLALIAVYFALL